MNKAKFATLIVNMDDRGVTDVILNRPEKKNALSAEMIAELTELCSLLDKDTETRVVVLSGAGDTFCAGGDLQWMKAQMTADRATRMSEARKLAKLLQTLNGLSKPVIGKVHGGAFGGGVGLACVCDYVVADESTKFGLTETRLGLIPATIGPYVIARLGEGMARRVFMSARVFSAQEALGIGLVAAVVVPAELNQAIDRQVVPYLSAAPGAVSAAKALARSLGPPITDKTIEDTISKLAAGHLAEVSALVDLEETIEKAEKDEEEGEADGYALELLTGQRNPSLQFDTPPRNGLELAQAVAKAASERRIEPGTLALCYGYQTNDWKTAYAALHHIYDSKHDVWRFLNLTASKQLDWSSYRDDEAA